LKIAFLGLRSAFDYHQIGGTESIIRRIAGGLITKGDRVDYLLLSPGESRFEIPYHGLRLQYFTKLSGLFNLLPEYDHVVCLYLPIWERLQILAFRLRTRDRLSFHAIHFSMSRSFWKRSLRWLDSRVAYKNVFVISQRLLSAAKRWGVPAKLLTPPVPLDYYVSAENKNEDIKLRVAYIGRTEKGKGFELILEIFSLLKGKHELELDIFGYHWPHDEYAIAVHDELLQQSEIKYHYSSYSSYTTELEDQLRRALRKTDVLFLPYKDSQSTIDLPLLLLEGLAASCAIITAPVRDIPQIYGNSPFFLSGQAGTSEIAALLDDFACVRREQARISDRPIRIQSELPRVVNLFRESVIR